MSLAVFSRDLLTQFCNSRVLVDILNNVRLNATLPSQQHVYSVILSGVVLPIKASEGDVAVVPTHFSGNPLFNTLSVFGTLYFMELRGFSYPIGNATITIDLARHKLYVLLSLTYGTYIRHTESYQCDLISTTELDELLSQLMSAVRQMAPQVPPAPQPPTLWQPYQPAPQPAPPAWWQPYQPSVPPPPQPPLTPVESLIASVLSAHSMLFGAPTPERVEELSRLAEFERVGRQIVSTAVSASKSYACQGVLAPREYQNANQLFNAVVGSVDCLLDTLKGKSYTCHGGEPKTAPGCILSEIIVHMAYTIFEKHYNMSLSEIVQSGYVSDAIVSRLKIDIMARGARGKEVKDICINREITAKAIEATAEACGIPDKYLQETKKRAPVAYMIAKAFMALRNGELTPEDVKDMMESEDRLEQVRKSLDLVMPLFSRGVTKSDAESIIIYTTTNLTTTLNKFYIDTHYLVEETRRGARAQKQKISKMCAQIGGEPPEYLYISTPLLCSIIGISVGKGDVT